MTQRPSADGESGFTLLELMISLGLFALIAVAGLGLVQGILNVQGRTEARLDRLAEFQRATFVLSSDIDQIASGRIVSDGRQLSFTRAAPGTGGEPVTLHYAVIGATLTRTAGPLPQPLLPGVAGARWRFWDVRTDGAGWVDHWPLSDDQADRWPRAIEIQMQVGGRPGLAGALRRVIVLPRQPEGA